MVNPSDKLHLKRAENIIFLRLVDYKTKFREQQAIIKKSYGINNYEAQYTTGSYHQPLHEFKYLTTVDIDTADYRHQTLVNALNIACYGNGSLLDNTLADLLKPLWEHAAAIEKLRIAISVLQDELNEEVGNVT